MTGVKRREEAEKPGCNIRAVVKLSASSLRIVDGITSPK
jgi:hypothetical protein